MKSLNRTLSLVLVLAMCLGLMGVASAAAYTDTATIKNTAAVETLSALGVIGGRTNGSFDPTGIVTRAEMCKMIVVALNGGVAPVLSASATPTYTDIKGTWAQAYIEYATKLGIVAGNGDGTFAPDATVTGSQAAKMMLVALGYDATAEGFTGTGWEIAVGVRASQKSLYSGLSLDPSAGLTRDNAAQVIYNGINAVMVTYDYKLVTGSNGQLTTVAVVKDSTVTANTIAADKFGLTAKYGIITKVTYSSVTKLYTYKVDASVVNATASFTTGTTFTSATDYSALFEQNVKVLYTTTTSGMSVYGVYAVSNTVTSSGVFGTIATAYLTAYAGGTASSFTYSNTTYSFTGTIALTPIYAFNKGSTEAAADIKATVAGAPTTYLGLAYSFIDNTGDGKADAVVLYPYSVAKVTYVGSTTATLTPGGSITLADVATYTGMAKGDYVKKTDGANKSSSVDTYEKITTFDGTVSKVDGTGAGKKVYIGSTWFVDVYNLMSVGSTYTKIAQVNTFIYDATVSSTVTSASQYAVLIAEGTDSFSAAIAQIMLSDGTIKTVTESAALTGAPKLVNYTISSTTGAYTFTNAAVGSYDAVVADGSDTGTTVDYAYSSTAGAGYIEGNAIDDSAVIFIKSGSAYKIMTGAQFKLLGTTSVTSIENAYVTTNTSTGFSTVKLAYAVVSSTALGSSNYGYVTANVTGLAADGYTSVSEISFWNGTENKTLKTTAVNSTIVKGMVITYTLNADGTFIPVPAAGLVKSAVTAYDGTSLIFEDVAANSSSVSSTKTTVMYIDSANYAGVAGGAIALADYISSAYVDNAYYIDGTSSGYALVVVDVKNAVASISAVTVTAAAADTAAELTALFTTTNTVTVSDAGTLADVTVPTGKVLNLAANTTITTLTANAGTINVAAAKTLTVTNSASALALKKVVGLAATSKLTLSAASSANYATGATLTIFKGSDATEYSASAALKAETFTFDGTNTWVGTTAHA